MVYKGKKSIVLAVISATIIAAVFFTSVLVGYTTSLDDLNGKIDDSQSKLENLDERIKNIEEKKKKTEKTAAEQEAEINRIRDELSKEKTEKERMIESLTTIKGELESLSSQIEQTQKEYEEKVALFLARAKLMYRYSDYSPLEILVESGDILEFSSRANLFNHMISYDRDLIDEISVLKQELDSKKAISEQIFADQNEIYRELEATISYLNALEDSEIAQYESSLNTISSLKALYEELEKESQELDKMIAALMAESKLYKYEGGQMLWPAESWVRVSDTYGWREKHPITGLPTMHGGIDISAYEGSNILAAAGGMVIVVNYSEGSGNYIVVDHGGGICTMYAHCSKVIAKVGDTVKKGQIIALVGSTGMSTGPHLHFEVREGSVKVDPMGYLVVPKK